MSSTAARIRPFTIPTPTIGPVRRCLTRLARPALERAVAFPQLNEVYERVQRMNDPERGFCEKALEAVGVTWSVGRDDLDRIPRKGPLVVTANHPFGGIDGMILAVLLQRVRPDAKLLVNYLLHVIPEMRELCFFVDPFGGPDAASRNLASMRQAMEWVKRGGALGVFPAGEVAHLRWGSRKVADPRWSDTLARIVRRGVATVVPVVFEGRNSATFQALGLIHPRLRTAMLARELVKQRGARVRVRVGEPIAHERLKSIKDDAFMSVYLRMRSDMLLPQSRAASEASSDSMGAGGSPEPIGAPQPVEAMRSEIAELPDACCLLRHGDTRVLCATARQIPIVLQEIGRLREIAFRAAGEGTGKAVDLDRFDEWYLHLFLWSDRDNEVVGAYRLAATDRVVRRQGLSGLYTRTLFWYKHSLLAAIGPALELGRSFVRVEHQRSYGPLMLLWKGIGRYVAAHPRYRMLFGPVSISNDYHSMSRQLLVRFLRDNRYLEPLARLVKPRNPPRFRRGDLGTRFNTRIVNDLEEVDELVREIEEQQRSIPVLLRQYLKLNGMLLGFNVDPQFGHVVDGLVLIDLVRVDRRILEHYMGRDAAARFLTRYLAVTSAAPAALAG